MTIQDVNAGFDVKPSINVIKKSSLNKTKINHFRLEINRDLGLFFHWENLKENGKSVDRVGVRNCNLCINMFTGYAYGYVICTGQYTINRG